MINPVYAILFFRTGMSFDSVWTTSVDDVEDVSGGLAREHLVALSIKILCQSKVSSHCQD